MVRISVALGLMALIYLVGEALFLTAAVKIALDGAYTGAVVALLFAIGIAAALVGQLLKSATLALSARRGQRCLRRIKNPICKRLSLE